MTAARRTSPVHERCEQWRRRHRPGTAAPGSSQRNTDTGVAHLYRLFFPHSELRAAPLAPNLSEDDVIWIAASPTGL